MSYNINAARNHPQGLDALLRVLEAAEADIVGLQEVDRSAARSGRIDQAEWLASRLGMDSVFGPAEPFADGGDFGNAILSRHPIGSTQVESLFHLDRERDAISEEVRSVPERVLPYVFERRSVLGAVIRVDGSNLNFFVTHFGLTPGQRLKQAEETAAFIEAWPHSGPVILAGDLNAIPESPEIEFLLMRFSDAFAGQLAESRISRIFERRGANVPYGRCIDYLLLGRRAAVITSAVLDDRSDASDHLPVVADLALT